METDEWTLCVMIHRMEENGSITVLTRVTQISAGGDTCRGVTMMEHHYMSGTLTEILETIFYVTIRPDIYLSHTPTSMDILLGRGGIRPWVFAHVSGASSSLATSTGTTNLIYCATASYQAASGSVSLRQQVISKMLKYGTNT